MNLEGLLKEAQAKGASDLHITENAPPIFRINGRLMSTDYKHLTRHDTRNMVYGILNEEQKKAFERDLELDLSLTMPGIQRVRINVHIQRGSIEAAFRLVSLKIRSIAELGLPMIVEDLARRPSGLVLITGPTGVGKTTTLAAMVDLINTEHEHLIVVVEDPIEYIHVNKKSVIKQRELYSDTLSFAEALKHALRQDPNVIVVGEMRDLDTISTTLTAAETGHLVLATLHTPDAPQTIDRIIDVFPPYQQKQIMVQLSSSLLGVVSQRLLPRIDEPGRIVATEVMVATAAIRNLIREHETEQLLTLIQTGSQYGMKTMDKSLKELYDKRIISYETAVSFAKEPSEFKR
ncbi:MAG: type IV pilus twitching motility protein PilT [Candidatus Omnitrophota bacterium]|nr:MAG: type IV pilus twitching motility protein PilT [Candidatus Omnitrophota bacterium]